MQNDPRDSDLKLSVRAAPHRAVTVPNRKQAGRRTGGRTDGRACSVPGAARALVDASDWNSMFASIDKVRRKKKNTKKNFQNEMRSPQQKSHKPQAAFGIFNLLATQHFFVKSVVPACSLARLLVRWLAVSLAWFVGRLSRAGSRIPNYFPLTT